jgi:hypothetical protein
MGWKRLLELCVLSTVLARMYRNRENREKPHLERHFTAYLRNMELIHRESSGKICRIFTVRRVTQHRDNSP